MSASVEDVLNAQHRRVAELFEQVSAPGADRPRVLQELLKELAAHIAAERSVVQPVVKSREIGEEALSGELIEDYARMEKLMVLIERRKFNSPDLPDLVTELKDASDAHIARTDGVLLPGLDSALSAEERSDLAERVSNADSMVTTHPHPHLLSLGGLSAKLTSVLSRFDWMRDKTVTNLPPPDGGQQGRGTEGGGGPGATR